MNSNQKTLFPTRLIAIAMAFVFASCAAPRKQASVAPTIRYSNNAIIGKTELGKAITNILRDSLLTPTIAGIKVVDVESGEVLFQRHEQTLFNPASTMKLFTSAAALLYLGPEFQYETSLVVDSATVAADTLRGDIFLVGAGDPSLKPAHLTEMIDALLNKGVRHISGDLVCDDTFFDDMRYGEGWMWDDQPYDYVAPISALSVNRSLLEIYASAGDSVGAPAKIRVSPANDFIKINNNSVTIDSVRYKAILEDSTKTFEHFSILRRWREQENVVDVKGVFVEGRDEFKVVRNIVHPTLFTGTLFKEYAERAGVTIRGEIVRGKAPENRNVLASHRSSQMTALVAEMNKPSDNVYAESLLKTVAAIEKGQPGTAANGADVIKEMLAGWGLNPKAYRIADGSGVSSYTLISPEAMTTLLLNMYRDFKVRGEFVSSLPIAGVDGTLSNRMKGTVAERAVRAKTGTLSGVSTLGGYTTTQDGKVLAFSMMMAHFVGRSTPYRNLQDRICEVLTRFVQRREGVSGRVGDWETR